MEIISKLRERIIGHAHDTNSVWWGNLETLVPHEAEAKRERKRVKRYRDYSRCQLFNMEFKAA